MVKWLDYRFNIRTWDSGLSKNKKWFNQKGALLINFSAGSQSASWELQAAWQQTGWGGLPSDPWCDQWDPRGNTRWCRGAAAAGHSLHALLLPAESGDHMNPVIWLRWLCDLTIRTLSGDYENPVRCLREPCLVTMRTLPGDQVNPVRWPFECVKVNPGLSIFGLPETLWDSEIESTPRQTTLTTDYILCIIDFRK